MSIVLQDSSELAAEPTGFVTLAAVAAQGAQVQVTLTLLPDLTRHLSEGGRENTVNDTLVFNRSLCGENTGSLHGENIFTKILIC